jgi:hypothetical protein
MSDSAKRPPSSPGAAKANKDAGGGFWGFLGRVPIVV